MKFDFILIQSAMSLSKEVLLLVIACTSCIFFVFCKCPISLSVRGDESAVIWCVRFCLVFWARLLGRWCQFVYLFNSCYADVRVWFCTMTEARSDGNRPCPQNVSRARHLPLAHNNVPPLKPLRFQEVRVGFNLLHNMHLRLRVCRK